MDECQAEKVRIKDRISTLQVKVKKITTTELMAYDRQSTTTNAMLH